MARFAGSDNTLIVNSVKRQLVSNGRANMGQAMTGGGNIDGLYNTFGYKKNLEFKDFMFRYRRNDIAKRIVNATVDFTWKTMPLIIDDEETKETETAFEEQTALLFNRFKIPRLFKRADKLACIGRYSVIVIGTKGDDLSTELTSKSTGLDGLAYLNVYSERQAKIKTYVTTQTDENFGYPATYEIDPNAGDDTTSSDAKQNKVKFTVHASRVIHIAEELLENELFGIPKLEAVYNLLDDLVKICGGSAEMFWLSAYQGIVFNVKDGYTLDEPAKAAMTEDIENYTKKLQRFIRTAGIEVEALGSTVADPRGNFEVIIKLIAGASNIPIRILLGSEQGQLAASVDQDTFFSYISSRRNDYAAEAIVKELLDRLVIAGILPLPKDETYEIKWLPLFEQTTKEKLDVGKGKVEALKVAAPYGSVLEIATVEEVREMLDLQAEIPESKYTDDNEPDLEDNSDNDEDELDEDGNPIDSLNDEI